MAKHKCLMCGDEFPIEFMFETLVCGNCIDADGSDLAKSEAELAQVKAERDRLKEGIQSALCVMFGWVTAETDEGVLDLIEQVRKPLSNALNESEENANNE